ncbi:MAG: hydrogenase maturation nickel metallochaperone HypA [Myxococcales bacterium]|nr:hydrogenase maturation nickel metallochaperone HypA [Myxococcales bacterium]
MHELSITRNIVSIVAEKAAGRRVERVRLQIGKLSGIEVQAIRFCYDVCAAGTVLEGSKLDVDEVAGEARCTECDKTLPIEHFTARCPCEKRARVEITRGEELLVKEMEVAS